MDGGAACSMAAAARRLVLWCARPAALEALGASVGVVLRGRDLIATILRRRGGGVRLVVLRPPRAALPAARACSASAPGRAWELGARAARAISFGEIVRGWVGGVALVHVKLVLHVLL